MKSSLLRELEKVFKGRIAADPVNRHLYSRDMFPGLTLDLRPQAGRVEKRLPDLVCWPETPEEIVKLVKLANRFGVPLIPFGGGSGVLGGTLPVQGGIILDMKRMNRILQIDRVRFTADMETGKLGLQLEEELNVQGLTLGHFPSSIMCATLGGYLATRSAGQMSSRYGKIEDMVEAIEVITPQGELVELGRRSRLFPKVEPKDLFVGTEGTCGIITKARLKIHPLPPARCYRGVSFNRVEAGLQAMREIMQSGLNPCVLRLYDPLDSLLLEQGNLPSGRLPNLLQRIRHKGYDYCLAHPRLTQNVLKLLPTEVILIMGFEGDEIYIEKEEEIALSICRHVISRDLGRDMGEHWWDHRYRVSFKMPQILAQNGIVDTIEVAGTWTIVPTLYQKIHQAISPKVLVMAHFSHAYPDGCSLYFTFAAKTGHPRRDHQVYEEVWRQAMETCLAVGGTISHHHGIGLWKAPYLAQELGGSMDWFRRFKKRLDPNGIMNPGKLGLSESDL